MGNGNFEPGVVPLGYFECGTEVVRVSRAVVFLRFAWKPDAGPHLLILLPWVSVWKVYKGENKTARKVEEKNRKQFRKICVDLLHEIWDNRDYYAPILN